MECISKCVCVPRRAGEQKYVRDSQTDYFISHMCISYCFYLFSETKISKDHLLTNRFILGNLNDDKSGSVYGAATFDEMEYWFGPREYLLAFGYILRGIATILS